MADCIICGKKLGQNKYDFGKNQTFCIDCMSCSICGSKATGEIRGIIGIQPFCEKHFEEAKVEMAKPVEEWSDKFVEAKLNHLKKWRGHTIEKYTKVLQNSNPSLWLRLFANPTTTMNLDMITHQVYQTFKGLIESIDKEITKLEQILIQRREATSNQSTLDINQSKASQDPITILKIRYAKGEISKDEYEEMLRTLEATR